MWNPNLTSEEQTIDQIWEWYEELSSALDDREERMKKARQNGIIDGIPPTFMHMTAYEVAKYYKRAKDELDNSVSLALVAAFEAALSVDLAVRIKKKSKHGLSKELKDLCLPTNERPLFFDILKIWKLYFCGKELSRLNNIFFYRHWLAHGRYSQRKNHEKEINSKCVKDDLVKIMRCMEKATNDIMYWKKTDQ